VGETDNRQPDGKTTLSLLLVHACLADGETRVLIIEALPND
jgi:hypothetical protein